MCSTSSIISKLSAISEYTQHLGSYITLESTILSGAITQSPVACSAVVHVANQIGLSKLTTDALTVGTQGLFDFLLPIYGIVDGASRFILGLTVAYGPSLGGVRIGDLSSLEAVAAQKIYVDSDDTEHVIVKGFVDALKGATQLLFSLLKQFGHYSISMPLVFSVINAFDGITDLISILQKCPDKVGSSKKNLDYWAVGMKAMESIGWLLLFFSQPVGYLCYVGYAGYALLTAVTFYKLCVGNTLQTMCQDGEFCLSDDEKADKLEMERDGTSALLLRRRPI